MSKPIDWGLACRDCFEVAHRTTRDNFSQRFAGLEPSQYGYFTGAFDELDNPAALLPLVEARAEIVALYLRLGGDVEDGDEQPDFLLLVADVPREELALLPAFLVEHEGHRLCPMSDDGVLAGGCPKKPNCPVCDVWQRCVLDKDHDGACATGDCPAVRQHTSVRALAEPVSETEPAPPPSFSWLERGGKR